MYGREYVCGNKQVYIFKHFYSNNATEYLQDDFLPASSQSKKTEFFKMAEEFGKEDMFGYEDE